MQDPRLQSLASILIHYSAKVQEGQQLAVFGPQGAIPLLNAIYEEAISAGAHAYTFVRDAYGRPGLSGQDALFYRLASDAQLSRPDPFMKLMLETSDAWIRIDAPDNTRRLSAVDPAKEILRSHGNQPLREIFRRRHASGELRWVYTLFPTAALAQEAEMSLREFEDFTYSACYADRPDPIAEWQRFHSTQRRWVDWLEGKRSVEVRGPEVDLRFSIEGRSFINCAGEINLPDGEIYTGPVEDSVEGWIRFSYPAIYHGRSVEGVELRFEKGRVVQASATKGQDFLHQIMETDAGARYVGEFAIGTNQHIQRFSRNILFDEKIGGTIHLALGSGYPETGSRNESSVHWDMICNMRNGGQILVDGEVFYDSGEFQI